MKFKVKFLFTAALLAATSAEARWATVDDAPWETEIDSISYDVESDGTYTTTVELQRRVLKDSGRTDLAVSRQHYNSNIDEFRILEAKTINEDKVYAVDAKSIEDKPLASSVQGFDQQHQVMVAFPEVKVGSRVYLKFRRKTKEAAIPKFFSEDIVFGWGELQHAGHVSIRSKLPLVVQKSDELDLISVSVQEKIENGTHRIDIDLKQSIYRRPVDEAAVYLSYKRVPWVTVSTARTWGEVMGQMSPKYEAVLSKPLPPLFEHIAEGAAGKKTLEEKINFITSQLATQVNYLGDWKSISGRYVPRELETIATTKLGDCKDYSASTVAILRKLGYAADVAFVQRGASFQQRPVSLPSLGDFNHAFVHMKLGNKDYWIDPTNFASFSQGIFPDIADRPALILRKDQPILAWTANPGPKDALQKIVLNVELADDGSRNVKGALELSGSSALNLTGAQLRASKRSIDYGLVNYFADRDRVTEWSVEPYDLTSRIVKDHRFAFAFAEKKSLQKTSAGPAYGLGTAGGYVSGLMTRVDDRVSDLYLGLPVTYIKETQLLGLKRVGKAALNCSIDSRWFHASRRVRESQGGIQVADRVVIKESVIENHELKAPAFMKLQESLNDCFHSVSIVYGKQRPMLQRCLATDKKN